MRLTAILLLTASLHAAARTDGQTVTLHVRDVPVKEVFRKIQRQTGLNVMIDESLIEKLKNVTLNMRNASVSDVLTVCFQHEPLTYTVNDGRIVIKQLPTGNPEGLTALPPPIAIHGRVTDSLGNPLMGASVAVKGSKRGVSTDADGNFILNAVDENAELIISFTGYENKQYRLNGQQDIKIFLSRSDNIMGEIVVTALGIKKSEKSLSYSAQTVHGEELSRVKTDNLMNTLNGKVAGVTISPSASGIGGSVKVLLRGSKSAAQGNGPLYVIDGVPITNSSNYNGQPNSTNSGAASDGGDGISNLNPDDIESINVLKGASASALYGSQAANGVIMIITKKGKAGRTLINFSSSAAMSTAAYKPEFQNNYGQTTSTSTQSWGAKISGATNNLPSYFQTGSNFVNSINLSGGSDNAQAYFSYAYTNGTGIEPNNALSRHNINFRETARLLNNKLTVDGSVNYMAQKVSNAPGLGLFLNGLTGLYLFPRGLDLSTYKTHYQLPDPARNGLNVENWPFNNADNYQQNPWWIANKNPNTANRSRMLLNASAKYDVADWLSIQARGIMDRFDDVYEQDLYAGTTLFLASANGSLNLNDRTGQQTYGDLLINFKVPAKSDFALDGVLGSSITDNLIPQGYALTQTAGLGLFIPNVFTIQNTQTSLGSTGAIGSNVISLKGHSQTQSIFANVNLSYREWLFLSLTGRNDWSSNLAFTSNESYFYPSAGLSLILNQVLSLPAAISYAKLRGSYAQVGNTVQQYASNPLNYLGTNGTVNFNSIQPFSQLKPERTNSFELGTEWRFFSKRLNFQFTYYKTNTLNQFFPIVPSASTGYSRAYVNAGNIQNSGVEIVLGFDVLKAHPFTWSTMINFSRNKNLVRDVDSKDHIDQYILTGAYSNAYESVLNKGGGYGDIYGYSFQRDSLGRILIGSGGLPTKANGFNFLGNPNPKFQLGWSNTLGYKNFILSFLIDAKIGGQVMSFTQAMMDQYGVSKASGDARDQGGVQINGADAGGHPVTSVDASAWYSVVGGRNGISGAYVYSASVVRLREASLGYSLPLSKGFFTAVRLSLTGRNLTYFYKKAPFDPELTMSTGNGLSGVDVFNQPASRSLGLNLNVSF